MKLYDLPVPDRTKYPIPAELSFYIFNLDASLRWYGCRLFVSRKKVINSLA